MIIDQHPFLFILLFACAWPAVFFVLSIAGGWFFLAEKYRFDEAFQGTKWHFQYARMGSVNYGACLTIGANDIGLYMRIFLPMAMGHSPLMIPWSDLSGSETKKNWWLINYIAIEVCNVGQTIKIDKKLADNLEIASNHKWKYQRLK